MVFCPDLNIRKSRSFVTISAAHYPMYSLCPWRYRVCPRGRRQAAGPRWVSDMLPGSTWYQHWQTASTRGQQCQVDLFQGFPIPVVPVLCVRVPFAVGAHASQVEQPVPFFSVFPRPELKECVHLVQYHRLSHEGGGGYLVRLLHLCGQFFRIILIEIGNIHPVQIR